MLAFRDTFVTIKQYEEPLARWVSYLISPHLVGVAITAIISFQYSERPLQTLMWLAFILPLIVVPIFLYVMWLVQKGKLEDIFMPRREDRLGPLVVALTWFMICLALLRYMDNLPIVEVFLLASLVLVGTLSLVTLFWKISFHGATISAAATIAMVIGGLKVWPVLLLVPLVGWARVRLRRHTPLQVLYGSLVGTIIALIIGQGMLLRLL